MNKINKLNFCKAVLLFLLTIMILALIGCENIPYTETYISNGLNDPIYKLENNKIVIYKIEVYYNMVENLIEEIYAESKRILVMDCVSKNIAIDEQLLRFTWYGNDCFVMKRVISFTIKFLEAFNNEDEERLKLLSTDVFFTVLQKYRDSNSQDCFLLQFTNDFIMPSNVLQLINIFNVPSEETISVSVLYRDFNSVERFQFIFNLFTKKELTENFPNIPHRFNVRLTLIYDSNTYFLVESFILTNDS